MIEDKKVDHARIADVIKDLITLGADVIVLGCTHYHWIETDIKKIADGKAIVLQPEQAIIKQLKKLIK